MFISIKRPTRVMGATSGAEISSKVARWKRCLRAFVVATAASSVVVVADLAAPVHATLSPAWTDYGSQLAVENPQSGNIAGPHSVAIGGGKIVIVGYEIDSTGQTVAGKNNVWVSNAAPISFTAYKVGSVSAGTMFLSVAYGNGVFLASGVNSVTQNPIVYSSSDGVTWTDRTSVINGVANFSLAIGYSKVTFDGTDFIVMGQSESGTPPNQWIMSAMVKSSNGQTWSAKQGPLRADPAFVSGQLMRVPSAPELGLTIAKNGSTMVIGGGYNASDSSLVVTTDNGSTWKFGYDGNSSDANGATEYFTVDGVSSSGGSPPNPAPRYQHVAYANGKFIGLVLNQSYAVSNAATSTNGLDWVTHTGVFGQASVFPIALGSTGSEFVFMTVSGVFTSSDGQTWNQIPNANLGVGAQQSSSMQAVVSGNGVTIMVGTLLDSNSVPVAPKVLLNGAAPTVTGVSPSSGSAAGGTAITITGTNFASGATVTVGGAACTNVVVVSPTSITCTTPARTAGTSSVVVTSGGQSNAANSLFTFNALSTTTTTTTAPAAGNAVNSAVSRLVNSSNQVALTATPGKASVLVNGVAVAPQIVTASNSAAAQADPSQRSPEQVRELQQTAATIETRLDTIAGGDSGVSVVRTETGAVLTGIFSGTRVPVEDVVVVNAANTATLFAARDVRGNIVEVKPGAVLEVTSNGDVAVQAFGLRAGETVELVVMSTPTLLGTFTVDAKGTIKTTAKLPTTIGSGNHSLVVASPSVKASLGLKLVKSSATLPETGSNTNDFSNWAVAVTLSGIYLMMVARSRRRVTWQ